MIIENEEFTPYYKNENYLISKSGKVYSLLSNKILKQCMDSGGYYFIRIRKNGKTKAISTHRMVAETFIPNPQNYKYINHIDEDKSNNNVENLEWCSNSYNNQTIRKKHRERIKKEHVKYIREDALKYLHSVGYTVRNKCARFIVKGLTYKNL